MEFICFLIAWGIIGIVVGIVALRATRRISHLEDF